jgi:hypothetical protein
MFGVAAAAFDPAITLFAAMTTQPDETRKTLISDTITALQAAGVWSLLDAVWFMAAHDEQASRLNWKAPASFTLATAGTITFTTDRGWQGDGASGYLNTGWIPAAHGVNYTLNDASFGVYSRTNSDTLVADIGCNDGTNRAEFFARTANSVFWRVNNTSIGEVSRSSLNSTRLQVARRAASTGINFWQNGGQIATQNITSSALVNLPVFIAARNNGGAAASFSTRQYALAFTGAGMSGAQQLALYNTAQAYMTAVGAAL